MMYSAVSNIAITTENNVQGIIQAWKLHDTRVLNISTKVPADSDSFFKIDSSPLCSQVFPNLEDYVQ